MAIFKSWSLPGQGRVEADIEDYVSGTDFILPTWSQPNPRLQLCIHVFYDAENRQLFWIIPTVDHCIGLNNSN